MYPVLKKRNLWGIFYIPTKPYEEKKLLDVHRVHYILGKYGGESILELLEKLLKKEDLITGRDKYFNNKTYLKQDNDEYTIKVKQIINYYMEPKKRSIVLKKILNQLNENENELFTKYYLNPTQINEMIDYGLAIACHGHSHTLFSNLNFKNQENEIKQSIKIINNLTNNRMYNSFCYPYGGKHSYNTDTLHILEESSFDSAISVESRNITKKDIDNKYEIPRYDCNEFIFGKATKGKK